MMMDQSLRQLCVFVLVITLVTNAFAGGRITWKLITPTYRITIIGCTPGDFLCKDVTATAENRATGQKIRLQGVSFGLGNCDAEDGNCRWGGFELKGGTRQYDISREGGLVVRAGEKSVREQGILEEEVH
jgi:hypothetical protein